MNEMMSVEKREMLEKGGVRRMLTWIDVTAKALNSE